VYAGVILLAFF